MVSKLPFQIYVPEPDELPDIVIFSGSPPKSTMCSRTQCKAVLWSINLTVRPDQTVTTRSYQMSSLQPWNSFGKFPKNGKLMQSDTGDTSEERKPKYPRR